MTTMLERAARAAMTVCVGFNEEGGDVYVGLNTAEELARAVLMAVRDANVNPDTYVTRFKFDSDGIEDNYYLDPDEVEDVFPHMIDAILAGDV